jgi:uncharacterized protein YpmS
VVQHLEAFLRFQPMALRLLALRLAMRMLMALRLLGARLHQWPVERSRSGPQVGRTTSERSSVESVSASQVFFGTKVSARNFKE